MPLQKNGCFIGGDTPDKVNNIYLNNVHLNLKKLTGYDGGVYDKRPCRGEGFIYNKVYGVYVENARDVEIDRSESAGWTESKLWRKNFRYR